VSLGAQCKQVVRPAACGGHPRMILDLPGADFGMACYAGSARFAIDAFFCGGTGLCRYRQRDQWASFSQPGRRLQESGRLDSGRPRRPRGRQSGRLGTDRLPRWVRDRGCAGRGGRCRQALTVWRRRNCQERWRWGRRWWERRRRHRLVCGRRGGGRSGCRGCGPDGERQVSQPVDARLSVALAVQPQALQSRLMVKRTPPVGRRSRIFASLFRACGNRPGSQVT
jgi:hypothetical protein